MKDTVKVGSVSWTGDNPFIYLKQPGEDGWSVLALYFRIAVSPLGAGHAMLLVEPSQPMGTSASCICLTDNEPMAHYLLMQFVAKFSLFRPYAISLAQAQMLTGCCFDSSGTTQTTHVQSVRHPESSQNMRMTWSALQAPFMVDVPDEKTQTGIHEMFTVFQPAGSAQVEWCDRILPGTTVERDFFAGRAQSAALAFSETWVQTAVGRQP
jgi:hypothetical protein